MDERKRRLRERLLVTFKEEAAEHLHALRTLLATGIETPDWLELSFRTIHTLKGAARSVGLNEIEGTCHQLESRLSRARSADTGATPELAKEVAATITRIERQMAGTFEGGGAASPSAAAAGNAPASPPSPEPRRDVSEVPSARPQPDRRKEPAAPAPEAPLSSGGSGTLVRVRADELDRLLAATEELLPITTAMPRFGTELRRHLHDIARIRRSTGRSETGESGAVADLETRLREIEGVVADLSRSILDQSRALTQTYDNIVTQGRQIRLVPAWTVLGQLSQAAEDLAAKLSKAVLVTSKGFDIEVDRRVLEALKDPLLHAVGNAIDHGIEPPEERRALGKPVPASVTLSVAALDDGRVEFRLSDDGRGFDLGELKSAAVRARVADQATVDALSESEQIDLAFRSGLSTSPVATHVSGHGLGLAILRDRVDDLKGEVQVQSQVGAGVTLVLTVPSAIAVFRVFQFRLGSRSFAIPVENVVGAFRVTDEAISQTASGQAVTHYGEAVPLLDPAELLNVPRRADEEERKHWQVLMVSALGRNLGLMVDDVDGESDVLFKPFQPPLIRVRHVSGIGLSGSGEIVPILRVSDMMRSWSGGVHRSAPVAERRRKQLVALVVDDSTTTRVMEQHLLEAAGYAVILAEDGVDALEALRTRSVDFVVSDIDMPRMDGFELTQRIRQDPRLSDLPVVLLTALESRRDKLKGMEAGANAYMTKSDFDQSRLLDILARLL